ncbi:hypothetical protein MKW94_009466 [Papaver nudicaule]|uniref:Cytochrome b5 heme-binding domain-containing protein n=1 Tax=Papaver nudicaule TaxID=74823 RepID=A0AA42ATR8_PAPNU|nr:hypothetical protein [Papaver nudicaule]
MSKIAEVYTLEEASKHNTKKDCWLILDGKVYNVTEYLDDHPGGDDVLVNATGRDAIEDFDLVGHSKSARELMENYLIGELDQPSVLHLQQQQQQQQQKVAQQTTQKPSESALNYKYWFIAVAIVCISVLAGYMYY